LASQAPLLDGMLMKMISGEMTLDTKFVLCSTKRLVETDSGVTAFAVASKPLYVNSSLLIPCSDYFKALLSSNGFAESQDKNLDEDHGEINIPYDYDEDSDLDEESEDTRSSPQVRPSSSNIGFNNRSGKVIVINDFAYKTWRSLLLYLHLGKIAFSPLSSSTGRNTANSSLSAKQNDGSSVMMTSAKSMYRLADKLGMEELATKALDNIKSQLTIDNVIEELFSRFTSWFPKVRDMELEFLFDRWADIRDSSSLSTKADEISRGALPHAGPVLLAIWKRAKA